MIIPAPKLRTGADSVYLLSGAGTRRGAQEIGNIFNDDFDRASLGANYTTDFTDATAVVVGNDLEYNKTISSSFDNFLTYSAHGSTLSNWETEATFVVERLDANSNGLALGFIGTRAVGTNRSIVAFYNNKTTSGNFEKITIYQVDSAGAATTKVTSAGTLTVNVGDSITIRTNMTDCLFTATVINNTTVNTLVQTYMFGLSSPELINTVGNFGIFNIGGDFTISDYRASSTEFKFSRAGFIGDSTTYGVGATTISDTWVSEIGADSATAGNNNVYTRLALGTSITDDILIAIDEIVSIDPDIYVMMIGTNDINQNSGGDGLLNAQTNIPTIVAALDFGPTIVLMTPLARNATDNEPLTDWIIATYAGTYQIIDLFDFTRDGATTNLNPAWTADGTHLNDVGQTAVKDEIISQLPSIL